MDYLFKAIFVFALLTVPIAVNAAEVVNQYTNSNFEQAYHDVPSNFTRDSLGNFYGETDSGKVFRQQYVATSIAVRLQRFSIDQAFFYISDRGIIHADSDIEALSVYLSLHQVTLEDFG